MAMKIHEVFIQLRMRSAAEAVAFYERAFGAKEKYRLVEPSGRVGHVELDFGGTTIMMSDEYPELDIRGPESIGATTCGIHLHVDDADAAIERAVAAGAKLLRPASDAFYGERSGTVRDPFGHEWNLGHEIEKVSPEEMQRRYTQMMNEGKSVC
jgi:PhnB protein